MKALELPPRPCAGVGCTRSTTHLSGGCPDHRDGLPRAVVKGSPENLGTDEVWRVVNVTAIGYRSEEWFTGMRFGRVDGPSRVVYLGDEIVESYPISRADPDRLSRARGPARRTIRTDGSVQLEEWALDGTPNRVDGPAWLHRSPDGSVVEELFYLRGHGYTSIERFATVLRSWKPPRLRREFEGSAYRPLLDEGADPAAIVAALAAGVWSVEGIREVLAGAPAEWVRSFESGAAVNEQDSLEEEARIS